MTHEPSSLAIGIFLGMVGVTLGISFYLGRKAKDSAGYFAAHGQIPWFVNGVAFASRASRGLSGGMGAAP